MQAADVSDAPSSVVATASSTSPRPLSLFSAINLVVASMIGAGVYTTSGFTLGDLGTPGRVIVAWIVGGMIALCGAISYGALARHFLASGGEYLFLSRAIHPLAGCVAGFVSILAGFTGATAIAAIAFETYLPKTVWMTSLPAHSIASLAIVIGAAMHGIQARFGPPLQDAMVVGKLILLGIFFGMAVRSYPEAWHGFDSPRGPGFSWSAFAVSLMWISLSYSGFNAAVYVAAEIHRPEVNVARSLWIATGTVTLIYIGLNFVFVYAPAAEEIVGQEQIAAIAARTIGGSVFEGLIRAALLVSLASSVSALMMSGPRVYARMADDGVLPNWFRFQKDVPTVAVLFQAILSLIVVQLASLRDLLTYLGFTLSVTAALTVATIFPLKARGAEIRIALYPLPPLLFVSATLLVAIVAAIRRPAECLAGIITLLGGAILYALRKRI